MSRPKGSKNKPKAPILTYETLDDILTPAEIARWLKISRNEVMRRIWTKEIPEDCYFMSGDHHKMIKSKIAALYGIREPRELAV